MQIGDYIAAGTFIDAATLLETPEQHECAMIADRICISYQTMRDDPDRGAKGQAAHDLLVRFKDLKRRHPEWIESANRYLARDKFKNADVTAWARKAWAVFKEWRRSAGGGDSTELAEVNKRLARPESKYAMEGCAGYD